MASYNPIQGAADTQGKVQDSLTQSYIARLNAQGQNSQNAILGASPILKQLNDFFQDRFNNPVPKALQDSFADTIRGAQSARGFGGAGTGVAGEEARFLTGVAEQQRMQLLAPAQQFAQGLLGMGGLGAAEHVSQQDVFTQNLQYKQFRLEHAKFNNSRNMGYVNATISAVGAVGGVIGSLGSAYNSYQQGQTAAADRAGGAETASYLGGLIGTYGGGLGSQQAPMASPGSYFGYNPMRPTSAYGNNLLGVQPRDPYQ